ncbi:rRNA maturation RNase YbeY [Mariprofundus ferrooxydans]|nr:rRNA maturation RNase YbeY [Mariprofundus ferrooxydans]
MIDVLIDDGIDFAASALIAAPQSIEAAVRAACACAGFAGEKNIELCVRFASDASIHALNRQWRDQDKTTDVLSFPMQQAPFDFSASLGDIALAVPFVEREAARLAVPVDDHCLHLIIHATLHLLGFDHSNDAEAEHMQKLETQAMQAMGLHNPYPVTESL